MSTEEAKFDTTVEIYLINDWTGHKIPDFEIRYAKEYLKLSDDKIKEIIKNQTEKTGVTPIITFYKNI